MQEDHVIFSNRYLDFSARRVHTRSVILSRYQLLFFSNGKRPFSLYVFNIVKQEMTLFDVSKSLSSRAENMENRARHHFKPCVVSYKGALETYLPLKYDTRHHFGMCSGTYTTRIGTTPREWPNSTTKVPCPTCFCPGPRWSSKLPIIRGSRRWCYAVTNPN